MDIWASYQKVAFGDFNTKRLLLSTGDRHHTSFNMIAGKCTELGIKEIAAKSYTRYDRYVMARNVVHDLFISIYDVNTSSALVARFNNEPSVKDWSFMIKTVKSWGHSNREIRVIGLQNTTVGNTFNIIENLHQKIAGNFIEIDLFGSDIRHIAFDLKTGVPYNLLLLNRIYRAGELTAEVKKAEVSKGSSELIIT